MQNTVKQANVRRTFYLPADLDEWVEGEAKEDSRSVSSYLNLMIRKAKNDSTVR